jgi:hypothetical protein
MATPDADIDTANGQGFHLTTVLPQSSLTWKL